MADRFWPRTRLTSLLVAALSLLFVTACETTVTVEATDLSKVKIGASRAEIDAVLGRPENQKQQNSHVLARYPYLIGGSEDVTTKGALPNVRDPILGLLVLAIAVPIMTGVHVVKTTAARSRLKEGGTRYLHILYGADGKAEWIGSAPIDAGLLVKARAGDAAAQHEIAAATLGVKHSWEWQCRSANQGYGPALVSLADSDSSGGYQKYLLYSLADLDRDHEDEISEVAVKNWVVAARDSMDPKLARIAEWILAATDRTALCDPDKPHDLSVPEIEGPEHTWAGGFSRYQRASCGDGNAQDYLGFEFNMGKGRPENPVEAYFWYGLAQRYAKMRPDRHFADDNRGKVRKQLTPELVGYLDGLVERWKPDLEFCELPWESSVSNRKYAGCGDAGAQDWLGLRYQNGEGVRRAPLEAHVWYGLAQRRAKKKYERLFADYQRGTVRARLTPAQIVDAEKRIEAWQPDTAPCKDAPRAVVLPPSLQAAALEVNKPAPGKPPARPPPVKPPADSNMVLDPASPYQFYLRLPSGDLDAGQIERAVSGAKLLTGRSGGAGPPPDFVATFNVVVTFNKDRTIEGESFGGPGSPASDDGTWSVTGDTLCIDWQSWTGGDMNCYRVTKTDKGFGWGTRRTAPTARWHT